MKHKKTEKANLEKKRFVFFQIGMIVALALVLTAFEWTSYDDEVLSSNELGEEVTEFEAEEIPLYMPRPPEVEQPKPTNDELPPIIGEPDPIIPQTPVVNDPPPIFIPVDTFVEWEEEVILDTTKFRIVEDMPFWKTKKTIEKKKRKTFTDNKIFEFLGKNVVYPQMAKDAGITGTVYVEYDIDPTGKVVNVKLARGTHKLLDAEALRVIKLMPNFEPGKQRGKPVFVKYTLPIRFSLK